MLALLLATAFAQDAPPPPPVLRPAAPVDTAAEPVESFRITVLPGLGWHAAPGARIDGLSLGFVGQAAAVDGVDAQVFGSVVQGDMDGVQASGWLNVAGGEASDAIQATGGLNVARDLDGLQLGTANVAQHVDGVQAGLLNVADDADGLQIGLVNVARTSEVAIAPINLIGDGLHRVDVWASESAMLSGAVKFGSKQVYTLIGAGWVNPEQAWWTFGGGLGIHAQRGRLWVEIDDSAWALASGPVLAPGVHNKLRLQVGVDLARRHLAPFAGVSINTWFGSGQVWPRAVDLPQRIGAGRRIATWPGVHAGVSF